LGQPPWFTLNGSNVSEVYSFNPIVLYQDILFSLDAAKCLNNGRPSLHALGLSQLNLAAGETVLHLGTGTGYYTALLSLLVGPTGKVIGVEAEQALLEKARKNLRRFKNVELVNGNGSDWPKSMVNAIYVNYAVQRPAE
jgi:protein-L-isoaspartate(D-aspartate) O-methyltransferase